MLKQNVEKWMQAHYVFWSTQNEFIELCAAHVKKAIINIAYYYGILIDGTRNVPITEQITFILLYTLYDEWEIIDRFLSLVD